MKVKNNDSFILSLFIVTFLKFWDDLYCLDMVSFILNKKQLLFLLFLFRLLIKYDSKFFLIWLYKSIKNKNVFSFYFYILNLLRIKNTQFLDFFFQSTSKKFFLKAYKLFFLIELDLINLYFVKFKSNFFCNWRSSKLFLLNYHDFNIRFLFFYIFVLLNILNLLGHLNFMNFYLVDLFYVKINL